MAKLVDKDYLARQFYNYNNNYTEKAKEELQNSINTKQATLEAGDNITIKDDKISASHQSIEIEEDTTSKNAPSFGEIFTAIDSITRDSYGHVTKINTSTITIPSSSATVTNDGLMSSADKIKLNGIVENANNYILPAATKNTLGGIKVGNGLSIDNDDVLSVEVYKSENSKENGTTLSLVTTGEKYTWDNKFDNTAAEENIGNFVYVNKNGLIDFVDINEGSEDFDTELENVLYN